MSKLVFILVIICYPATRLMAQDATLLGGAVNPAPIQTDKYSYRMNTGTSFAYAPGIGNSNTFYIAPEFRWKLNPKMKVSAGLLIMRNQFNLSPQNRTVSNRSVVLNSPTSYSNAVYVNGVYDLTPKISVYGSVLTDLSTSSAYSGARNGIRAANFTIDYRISDNVTFGAAIHYVQTNMYSPFAMYNNGFGSGAFGNSFNPF